GHDAADLVMRDSHVGARVRSHWFYGNDAMDRSGTRDLRRAAYQSCASERRQRCDQSSEAGAARRRDGRTVLEAWRTAVSRTRRRRTAERLLRPAKWLLRPAERLLLRPAKRSATTGAAAAAILRLVATTPGRPSGSTCASGASASPGRNAHLRRDEDPFVVFVV